MFQKYYSTILPYRVKHCISNIRFTDHAFEKTDGSEKSECELPESIIEKWIKRRKGNQFYDREKDSLIFIHQKTVVVTDYDPKRDLWLVITVYRSQNHAAKHGHDRYSEVAPQDFKQSRRKNQ